ncbi:nicotinamide-nucleotide amidase [Sphingopyxis sp. OAS728]|uniref:CinA family protein n=1 Tax=Sphingopyxis sp. OAS728 TaxID=2663823 RepID=UPI0017891F48|nr:CinA family protein [Sphingopyxis sp. OAS728]MBE1529726.1 nicotinamide-nucleotide amidase [Sphingopyxis sp. OAS728]
MTAAAIRGIRLALVEYRTGGAIAAGLGAIDTRGHWIDLAVTVNERAAMENLVGVAPALIDAYGAVSRPVTLAMAEGFKARTDANLILSATVVAAPAAAGEEEGLLFLAARSCTRSESRGHHLGALDSEDFQARVALAAFMLLESMLEDFPIASEQGAVVELLPTR